MKKAIKGVAQGLSVVCMTSGLVLCMCEADSFEKQIIVSCTGLAVLGLGVLFGSLCKAEEVI